MSTLPRILTGKKNRPGMGIIKIKDRDWLFFGDKRYRIYEKGETYKPEPKPEPKDCPHQWRAVEKEYHGKIVPVRVECLNCGTTCENGDKLKAHNLGIIKCRIVVVSSRFPRTKENRKLKLRSILKKLSKGILTKKKAYRRWLKLIGRSSSSIRWKKFLMLMA